MNKAKYIAGIIVIYALAAAQSAQASTEMESLETCRNKKPTRIQDPGFGDPVRYTGDKGIIKHCEESTTLAHPNGEVIETNHGGACESTLGEIQIAYNDFVREKVAFCAVKEKFRSEWAGCMNAGSAQGSQRKCFFDKLKTDKEAAAATERLIKKLEKMIEEAKDYAKYNAQAAAELAEIGEKIAKWQKDPSETPRPDREASRVSGSTAEEGAKNINPRRLSPEKFAQYKQFIEQLAKASGISPESRQQAEQIESPLIREQAMAIVRAKEFQASAKSQLDHENQVERQLAKDIDSVNRSNTDMTSMNPSASSNPFNMNQALMAGSLANQAAARNGNGNGNTSSKGPNSVVSGPNKDLAARLGDGEIPASTPTAQTPAATNDKDKATTDTPVALASAGNSLSAKEKLRAKLRNSKGASRMPGALAAASNKPVLDKKGRPIMEKDGTPLTEAELAQAIDEGQDPLAAFGINLGDGDVLSLAGSETDASVQELVNEMKQAMGLGDPGTSALATLSGSLSADADQQGAREILAADSSALFDRIRDLHSRCLKKGCVLGKMRDKL